MDNIIKRQEKKLQSLHAMRDCIAWAGLSPEQDEALWSFLCGIR